MGTEKAAIEKQELALVSEGNEEKNV